MVKVARYSDGEVVRPGNEAVSGVWRGGEDYSGVVDGEGVAVKEEDVLKGREEDGQDLVLEVVRLLDAAGFVVDVFKHHAAGV